MARESDHQKAGANAIQTVPGVVYFDPPSGLRNQKKKASREAYLRALRHALGKLRAAIEEYGVGALVTRHNVGGAMLPAGRGRTMPVFYNLPGQYDWHILLGPSGRMAVREWKDPERREKKDGTLGAFLSNPSPQQRAWGEIYEAMGVDHGVLRTSAEAVEDMRRLLDSERKTRRAA